MGRHSPQCEQVWWTGAGCAGAPHTGCCRRTGTVAECSSGSTHPGGACWSEPTDSPDSGGEGGEGEGVKQTRDKIKFVTGPGIIYFCYIFTITNKLLPSSYFSIKPESAKIQHHAVTLPPNLDFNSWNWDTWPPCKVSLSGPYKYWVHQNTTNPAVGVCWGLGWLGLKHCVLSSSNEIDNFQEIAV